MGMTWLHVFTPSPSAVTVTNAGVLSDGTALGR
jgi:hypothetical protein